MGENRRKRMQMDAGGGESTHVEKYGPTWTKMDGSERELTKMDENGRRWTQVSG